MMYNIMVNPSIEEKLLKEINSLLRDAKVFKEAINNIKIFMTVLLGYNE